MYQSNQFLGITIRKKTKEEKALPFNRSIGPYDDVIEIGDDVSDFDDVRKAVSKNNKKILLDRKSTDFYSQVSIDTSTILISKNNTHFKKDGPFLIQDETILCSAPYDTEKIPSHVRIIAKDALISAYHEFEVRLPEDLEIIEEGNNFLAMNLPYSLKEIHSRNILFAKSFKNSSDNPSMINYALKSAYQVSLTEPISENYDPVKFRKDKKIRLAQSLLNYLEIKNLFTFPEEIKAANRTLFVSMMDDLNHLIYSEERFYAHRQKSFSLMEEYLKSETFSSEESKLILNNLKYLKEQKADFSVLNPICLSISECLSKNLKKKSTADSTLSLTDSQEKKIRFSYQEDERKIYLTATKEKEFSYLPERYNHKKIDYSKFAFGKENLKNVSMPMKLFLFGCGNQKASFTIENSLLKENVRIFSLHDFDGMKQIYLSYSDLPDIDLGEMNLSLNFSHYILLLHSSQITLIDNYDTSKIEVISDYEEKEIQFHASWEIRKRESGESIRPLGNPVFLKGEKVLYLSILKNHYCHAEIISSQDGNDCLFSRMEISLL